MANAIYPNFGEHCLKGDIDIDTATGDAYLVDLADYTYAATHDTITDVPAGARVSTVALASLTPTDGVLDAANFTFPLVSGDECEAVIITISSGGTEYLAAFYDAVTGLPVTPTGTDIPVTVDPSGLLSLVG